MNTLMEPFRRECGAESGDDASLAVARSAGRSAMSQRIALIDSVGVIVAVNRDWVQLAGATRTLLSRVGEGANYLEVCRSASVSCEDARKARAGICAVLGNTLTHFEMDYACPVPSEPALFRMNVTPIAVGSARAAIVHTDVTEIELSKHRLQQFARRLIYAQEDERQRISRDLHDDFGNRIALMALSIRRLIKERPAGFPQRDLEQILAGITDFSAGLRNLSHDLHPAQLEYVGLHAALLSLGDVLRKTSGIELDVIVPGPARRLPAEVELCLFRVSQECLQNVVKHSGVDKARIVLESDSGYVRLTVSDEGRGFITCAARGKGGLGLQSMEERALSIGGHLTVKSSPGCGTEIRVTIPLSRSSGLRLDESVTNRITDQLRDRSEAQLAHD
jgi:signal transduction histidine kinase